MIWVIVLNATFRVFYRITNANIYDAKSWIGSYTNHWPATFFDRGRFDLTRLYQIAVSGAFFIIHEKNHPGCEAIDGEDLLDDDDNVLRDQTVVKKSL